MNIQLENFKSSDVNLEYLSWFSEKSTQQYIEYARSETSLNDLKKYVRITEVNKSILFYKILAKNEYNELIWIGTIKAVILSPNVAEIGIMIGNNSFRGQGVGSLALKSLINLLVNNLSKITLLRAGVVKSNVASLRLFEKNGFKITNVEANSFELLDGSMDDQLTLEKVIG